MSAVNVASVLEIKKILLLFIHIQEKYIHQDLISNEYVKTYNRETMPTTVLYFNQPLKIRTMMLNFNDILYIISIIIRHTLLKLAVGIEPTFGISVVETI